MAKKKKAKTTLKKKSSAKKGGSNFKITDAAFARRIVECDVNPLALQVELERIVRDLQRKRLGLGEFPLAIEAAIRALKDEAERSCALEDWVRAARRAVALT